jgi:ribosome modulation factor
MRKTEWQGARYKRYEQRMKPYMEEGLAHAKAGGDVNGVEKYQGPNERSAWIVGWRNGGGDIQRGVVVTQAQRWQEERTALLQRLAWLDERLAQQHSEERHG